ncbi:hypothetical protein I3760_13G130500 [Carya illinoinensis]|nr:hypothetical protein I3760_13G130500 [Carya illinoinensis]
MCKQSGETLDHLLLHCDIVRALWVEVFSRVELAWVMSATVVDLLACWLNLGGIPQISAVWKMIPICLFWCIWKEQNDRTFEDKEHSMEEIRLLFVRTLFLWAKAVDFNGLGFHEFLISLSSS